MKRTIAMCFAVLLILLCVMDAYAAGTEGTAAFNPETGSLTMPENKGNNGVLNGVELKPFYMLEGFCVPVPVDEDQFAGNQSDEQHLACYTTDKYAPGVIYLDYKVYDPIDEFIEIAENAERWYDMKIGGLDGMNDLQQETILISGHPARVYIMTVPSSSGDYSLGIMMFGRNNRICRIRLFSGPQNGATLADIPKVTMDDMQRLADAMVYDPAQATITTADGEIILSAKGGATTLSGGKKLQMTAVFANKDKVNKKAKNDTLEWSAVDAETGEPAVNLKMDKKGTITADKTLSAVQKVEILAVSPIFHTSAAYSLTLIPTATGLTAEPSALTFYRGESRKETIYAVLTPDTVPPEGIIWKAKPENIVEISSGENGTATVKPLAAGKTVITVKEPGGKSAKVKISVLEPVESVKLKAKGEAIPGGTVTLTAALSPKKAGNKSLEWSVIAGEDVATINAEGQLKIGKTAPEGTVITVTCRALGAPEPVTAMMDIIVEK